MNFTKFYKSQRSALWKATLLFTLVSGSLIAADQLSIRYGLEGSQRIVDDLLGGLIAGSIFHLYERRRLRRLSEQLQVIDLMNHHIRNALQPLMFGPDEPGGKAYVKLIEECVRHIDWALREVLPGKSKQQFVAHDGFVRNAGPSITSRTPSSSKTRNCGPKPTTRQAETTVYPMARYLEEPKRKSKLMNFVKLVLGRSCQRVTQEIKAGGDSQWRPRFLPEMWTWKILRLLSSEPPKTVGK